MEYEVTGQDTRRSVSGAGVVIDEYECALVIQRRDNARWEPPGGILERDETITEGLLREVREETGLVVEPVALTGVYKNMSRGIVALVFRCRMVGGRLTENSEVTGFRWVKRSDVSAMMSEAFAVRILDAYQPGAIPAVREQDGVSLVTAVATGDRPSRRLAEFCAGDLQFDELGPKRIIEGYSGDFVEVQRNNS